MKKIGLLTSGGDASGMNAAIRAVVRTAITYKMKVVGFKKGFLGLIKDYALEMDSKSVSGIICQGGTILHTTRCPEFKEKKGRAKAIDVINKHKLEGIVVIGGEGSMRGLAELIEDSGIAGIGIPGTIDNDIFGTDYAIGFDTAVNVAVNAIDNIRDTATSHERLFLVEVMGRHAGYIAIFTGIASGVEDCLVPETISHIDILIDKLKAGHKRGKESSIVIVAEGDDAGGAFDIEKKIRKKTAWETRVSVLGHIQRGGRPTAIDRINASRLGVAAVEALKNGVTTKMVGLDKDDIAFVDLEDVWSKKKELSSEYIRMVDILST
ncbi:6-phosphofructokinase [bacterium]|nr:6-phosphofructokinase [bacterium]